MVLSFIFDRNRNVCEDIQEIRQIKKKFEISLKLQLNINWT